jgi:hypothetical protein
MGKKWVFTNEQLINKCLDKIKAIPDDETLFCNQLKIDLIKQWLAEIERIQKRKELNNE